MKHTLIAIFLLLFLSSCYTYKIYPKEFRRFEYNGEKQIAFIENPELEKEYNILKESGVFSITADTPGQNSLRIKLYPLEKKTACGQGGILSLFTLGQVPVFFPDRYTYHFEEISPSGTVSRAFELCLTQRVWFWDVFAFNKKFNQKAGRALLGNHYSK